MLEQYKNDTKFQKWIKSNPWFLTDRFLLLQVLDIRDELLANNYIEDSIEYLKEIEVRIYKMFPERIKKYYSNNS